MGATGGTNDAVDAPALLQYLARTSGVTPDTVAAALLRLRNWRLRAAVLAEIAHRWGNGAVQQTLEAEHRLHDSHAAPVLGAHADPDGQPRATILIPDADHPSKRDIDGEQVIQTDKTIDPGRGALIRNKSWKSLAEVAESVDVKDDSGDTLHIDLTYRLESRPAELGDIPDMWIHTERKALLTLGSGDGHRSSRMPPLATCSRMTTPCEQWSGSATS